MDTAQLNPTSSANGDATGLDPLRLAIVAYLARYKGQSRVHTDSDLRSYLGWCSDRGLNPLQAQRAHLELYLRWMQEVRRYKPSTVSRRLSVLTGFYRTCVIDGVLEHSPADYVRRPHVPPESPTLGLSHLQFEAMLTAGRDSENLNDFALVAMLGLLGLRIFEATGANIEELGEVHGHRVLRVHGKGDTPLGGDAGRSREAMESTGRAVAVHAIAGAASEHGAVLAVLDGAVYRSSYRRGQRHQGDLCGGRRGGRRSGPRRAWWSRRCACSGPSTQPQTILGHTLATSRAVRRLRSMQRRAFRRQTWILRHKVLSGILAFVLIPIAVGALAGEDEDPVPAASDTSAEAADSSNTDTSPISEPEPVDTDGDGVIDDDDFSPNDAQIQTEDDVDTDKDGVPDYQDYRPEDRKIQTRDDVDTDKDGVPDYKDDLPKDAQYSKDTDGDGVADQLDDFPKDERYSKDSDGDKVADSEDVFPADPSRSKITAQWRTRSRISTTPRSRGQV
jgi:integrase